MIIPFIGLSLLVTPPVLWIYCYHNIIAQPDPTDDCKYLTATQAKKILVKRTLKSGALKWYVCYVIFAVWAISVMAR